MNPRLMLLDTASLYFRAFYGVPDTVRSPDGVPVNAARGLLDIITKLVTVYEPTHIVACWDDDWRPQWRVDLVPSYKAHRVAEIVATGPDVEEVPDSLEAQLPLIRDALAVVGIAVLGAPGYEADDVIGTLASSAEIPVDIVTGDRDLFQLIDDVRDIRVIYTAKGMSHLEVMTEQTLRDKYGVTGAQYADFATLRGDSSDGLPGVRGVGDKTAAALLSAHGDLAGVISEADHGDALSPNLQAKIRDAAEYLAVAPQVVAVARDVPLTVLDTALQSLTPEEMVDAERLASQWGLGAAITRLTDALTRY
ncbi:5'-3' exonuclease [Microbacterium halimionae]|uniref:5'-3' exonuclease n=1 Tax=Microbacterium halimionae TaxID=1526413 RepID=A0A7W3PL73_9MICO|nr:5'-3' exonuclease [Microbacterium halimionae]MBA8816270.1 5'-3' exonuclease [Microbacterium halimionae]NII96473.1 5'-3' exonuclease [Microbacterium halimionae]